MSKGSSGSQPKTTRHSYEGQSAFEDLGWKGFVSATGVIY